MAGAADEEQADLRELMDTIYSHYSYDFRDYAQASQQRRVHHALARLGCVNIAALRDKIVGDPAAFLALLQILTIPVTQMFRDPGFFLALREQVLPVLTTYPSLKIWIAGCSTGEELYSMAILLKEEGLLERSLLYATDINPVSLEKARAGVFPLAKMAAYQENYQQAGGRRAPADYYTASGRDVYFDRSLRDNVIFADHSLATDNVFSEMHLICCRNVLIYFNNPLQERALGLFHESLCHRGFLGLGSKESLHYTGFHDRFESVNKQQKVYRKL